MIGHLTHPTVALGLLLEHGCEKTHNDHVRHEIQKLGISPESYGWASVQLDGGIDAVIEKVQDWFSETLADKPSVPVVDAGLEHLCIAVTSTGEATEDACQSLTQLTYRVAAAGGTVIVPANATFITSELPETLAYGQRVEKSGFHIMETPTDQPTETLTGLGATGCRSRTRTYRRRALAIACDGAVNSGLYRYHNANQLWLRFGTWQLPMLTTY